MQQNMLLTSGRMHDVAGQFVMHKKLLSKDDWPAIKGKQPGP
jgi:hypothetical protein